MIRRLALLTALVLAAGCTADSPVTPGNTTVALAIAPMAIVAGDSLLPLVQVTVDGTTRAATAAEISVTSSDTSIIVIAPNGALIAVGDGQADITIAWIASPGVSVTRTVAVTTELLSGVALATPVAMIPGDSATLVVTGSIRGGRHVIDPNSVTVTSSNATVVAVSGMQIVADAPGVAWLVAKATSGVADSLLVTVAVGPPAHLTITPHVATVVAGQTIPTVVGVTDRRGNAITGVTPSYSTSASGVAMVQADGTIIGMAAGSASIVATAGAAADTVQLTVTPAPVTLARLVATPDSVQIAPGGSITIQVQGFDNLGHSMTPPAVTWQSFTPGVTVSSAGVIQASPTGGPVTGLVQLSSGLIVAQVKVVVAVPPPVLGQLVVSPDSVTLGPGGSTSVTVHALDTHGQPMTLPALTWQSLTGGITVTTAGLIQASGAIVNPITNGAVRVSSGAINAQVRVAVIPAAPVLTQLIPSPDSITLAPGGTAGAITVAGLDNQGHAMALPPLTWQSLTAGITVSSSGVIQAANTISVTIPNGTVQLSGGGVTAQVRVAVVVPVAPPPPDNGYVQIRWVGAAPTPAVAAAFESARTKLNGLFLSFNGVTALNPQLPANYCLSGSPALNEMVTGIVIFAQVTPIDGVGNILGSAGPCVLRSGTYLPVTGAMQFDSADMASMVANGSLNGVVLHEMMHTLGFGTIWGPGWQGEVAAPNGADPRYLGSNGQAGYVAVGGLDGATGVPVENTGGSGTRGAHWREASLHTELMTGWADGSMPMSRVTVGALKDFGYDVDVNRADPFSLAASLRGASLVASQQIGEQTVAPIGVIDRNGTITPYRGMVAH